MSQEIIKKAGEIIASKTGYIGGGMEGYATLTLIDENGYPTASTLTIAKADGIKWLTFCTSNSRNSVKRIKKCNRAGVCINSAEYNITLVGTIEILTDAETKQEMWFPPMEEQWSGPDDPEYCVLRFNTERYSLFVGYEEAKGTLSPTKDAMLKVTPPSPSRDNSLIEQYKGDNTTRCYGCGAIVDNIIGRPHKYIGATQGCWNFYGEILAKEFGEYNYPETTHRLTVDTYAVQHPGQPCRQSIQSVNLHLISLYFVLVKNSSGKEATIKMKELLSKKTKFDWLEPPAPNGQKTVIDVLRAASLEEHEEKVREWAENVWNCWYSKHKQTIDGLVSDNF